MNFLNPIETPVTGQEDCSDPRQPMEALSQFYRALNTRDVKLMQENWADSAEIAMDNPLGGIRRGWTEIAKTYQTLFKSPLTFRFEFHDFTLHQSPELCYVVGRERGEIRHEGRNMLVAIRTTRIFRRSDDAHWRQVHHHGSIDDPQILGAYQEAVLGNRIFGQH